MNSHGDQAFGAKLFVFASTENILRRIAKRNAYSRLINMTKYRSIVFIGMLLLTLSLPMVATAQKSVRLTATPKQFQVFYAKFKAAMLRKDKNTIAAMTSFPFLWGLDEGDEGTYTKAQFIRNFNRLFDPVPDEFRVRNPKFGTQGRDFTLSTDSASHYGFERKGNTYKFVSYIVEP